MAAGHHQGRFGSLGLIRGRSAADDQEDSRLRDDKTFSMSDNFQAYNQDLRHGSWYQMRKQPSVYQACVVYRTRTSVITSNGSVFRGGPAFPTKPAHRMNGRPAAGHGPRVIDSREAARIYNGYEVIEYRP